MSYAVNVDPCQNIICDAFPGAKLPETYGNALLKMHPDKHQDEKELWNVRFQDYQNAGCLKKPKKEKVVCQQKDPPKSSASNPPPPPRPQKQRDPDPPPRPQQSRPDLYSRVKQDMQTGGLSQDTYILIVQSSMAEVEAMLSDAAVMMQTNLFRQLMREIRRYFFADKTWFLGTEALKKLLNSLSSFENAATIVQENAKVSVKPGPGILDMSFQLLKKELRSDSFQEDKPFMLQRVQRRMMFNQQVLGVRGITFFLTYLDETTLKKLFKHLIGTLNAPWLARIIQEVKEKAPSEWRDLLGVNSAKTMMGLAGMHLGNISRELYGNPNDPRVINMHSETAKILLANRLLDG